MMVLYAFSLVISLFAFFLFIKKWLPFTVCVICLSISLTWVTLLTLYHTSIIDSPVLVAMLMGQSVLGIYYLVEKRVPEHLTIFRLPFLLTLTLIAYTSISLDLSLATIALVIALWGGIMFLYIYRQRPQVNSFVKKMIDCCSKW